MLKIINDLRPFFEDCYRRINVREYAKIVRISPPTASSILMSYRSEDLLVMERYKNYMLFFANKDSKDFIDLSRMYWRHKLNELIRLIEKNSIDSTIILFGSLSKAEVKNDSDADIAIIGKKGELAIKHIEKKLKRKIQLFWFDSINSIKNKDLAKNVVNGYVLSGRL